MPTKSPVKRLFGWLFVLALLGVGGFAGYRKLAGPEDTSLTFETVPVDRGDVVKRVTATGTLSPLVTVEVGSQVSGRIAELNADFNSTVEPGQVLAQLDTQAFEAALEQANANYASARANLSVAEAQATDAERQADRAQTLAGRELVAQAEADTAESSAEVARARVEAARAEVRRARAARDAAQVNLDYTTVYSPIHGTVISRDVDVGQTVAASLSAPTLFVIAEDLRRMQVNTSVAEADVGQLQDGMPVTFTVDAFPDDTFEGVVRQIRNSPETVQNVVTYDAVVDVSNDELKLRPGMTANVTFVVEQRQDVVRIPNTVLRFRAPESLVCEPPAAPGGPGGPGGRRASGTGMGTGAGTGEATASSAEGTGAPSLGRQGRQGGGRGRNGGGAWAGRGEASGGQTSGRGSGRRMLWVLRDAAPTCVPVRLGLTDGSYTEVLGGGLSEGDELVTNAVGPDGESVSQPPSSTGGQGGGRRGFRMF